MSLYFKKEKSTFKHIITAFGVLFTLHSDMNCILVVPLNKIRHVTMFCQNISAVPKTDTILQGESKHNSPDSSLNSSGPFFGRG